MLWALIGALFVGLSLGLLGSGGAILTVPILVYLVGHSEKAAIVESLAIVGSIALVAAIRAFIHRHVDLRSALLLSLSGIPGTYLGVYLAMFLPGSVQLAILATLMLVAAAFILKTSPSIPASHHSGALVPKAPIQTSTSGVDSFTPLSLIVICTQGIMLGIVTGLVGIGGGFLIIPLLLLIRKIPIAVAVGTSLVIIAINSATGFLKHVTTPGTPDLNWHIMILFSLVGILASQLGMHMAHRINQTQLKRLFAAFLVIMAIFILARQHPRLQPEHLKAPHQLNRR